MPRGRPGKKSQDPLVKSAELIGWALGGLEREIVATRARLASLTAEASRLRTRLGRRGAAAVAAVEPAGVRRKRRKMSAEARKRISDMMKKRWAERRRAKGAK
jgi:hypothetical protein